MRLGLESLRRVVTKNQNCPSPAAITRARLALACTGTRERFNLVLHPNLVLQVRNTCILAAWDGMKFNGFSTFLYRLAEFHLVLHFVLRLRKARNHPLYYSFHWETIQENGPKMPLVPLEGEWSHNTWFRS
jgi:hypothetical protein